MDHNYQHKIIKYNTRYSVKILEHYSITQDWAIYSRGSHWLTLETVQICPFSLER